MDEFVLELMRPFADLLRKVKYLNRNDALAEFEKLKVDVPCESGQKGNVLLFPFRVSPESNMFEGILGYALKLRGYNPIAILCGQYVSSCDNYTTQVNKIIRCTICLAEQKKFQKVFGLKTLYLAELCKSNNFEIYQRTKKLNAKDILNYKYKNIIVTDLLAGAMQRYYLTACPDYDQHIDKLRDFLNTSISIIDALDVFVSEYNPIFAITSHGVYSTWGTAAEYFKIKKIPFITWGRGYIQGNILASHNESYLIEPVFEENRNWTQSNISHEQEVMVKNYFETKLLGKENDKDYVSYYSKKSTFDKDEIHKILGLNNNTMKFGLYPNITWDGQVFNKSSAFPSIIDWLFLTINWFIEHNEYSLIIRSHPAELTGNEITEETVAKIIGSKYDTLPSNIRVLGPDYVLTSYQVASICNFAIVYGSSLGPELAFRKQPVIMAGNFYYKNKGFTFDANSLEEYYSLLKKAGKGELHFSEEMYQKCIKYSYHYLFKRHFPEQVQNLNGLRHYTYKINSTLELSPGKNNMIDQFIDCCIEKKPFYFDLKE